MRFGYGGWILPPSTVGDRVNENKVKDFDLKATQVYYFDKTLNLSKVRNLGSKSFIVLLTGANTR